MTQFQVNSILASDRTLIKKKSKQDDFLEHQSILQQALTAKPCDDGNANGKPPTTQRLLTLSFSRFTWHPDQLQRKDWRLWNSPDREIFTGGSKEPTDPGRDNLMQGSCSKLHRRFTFFGKFLSLPFVLELKNCSKKEPGFERCQCLEAMNESNVETVKVKYAKPQGSGSYWVQIILFTKGCQSPIADYKREALSRKKSCISAVQTCKQASVRNFICCSLFYCFPAYLIW